MRAEYSRPNSNEVIEVTICGYVYDSVTHDTLAVIKFDSGTLASVYLSSLKAL